ncbi:SulP family inorganic anion transporter [Vicingaceae bacterium]|nr:SulP family inorganic anion transporter [Vicingaceae bacterium]MDB4060583.1 SulP family inorganic anion transporter [Vicingaceae bacterium]MDC1452445.1 SulP family inorganic anion transporter [Vicingaceae bacterium]
MAELFTGIRGFKQSGFRNLLSGFVVSLIALPLALGLAIASGVPPMSGIIAVVTGGIVASILGGSNVTISGPGNGLVVVVLTSVVALGDGNLVVGYSYTLAAIVCSGALINLLGFLRLGNLADFFPSATIQGMLSAIGLIIIAKQIHVMFGESGVEAANNLMLLAETPKSILAVISSERIPWVAIIGSVSLAVMAFYSKIRNRVFQAIPAPFWIVVITIGFYYYFEWISADQFPIASQFLIQIPSNLKESFVLADFAKWNEIKFLVAVVSITLIATIESLLSIKAVDKLDVYQRRSNVNKDLKALGLATVLSGLVGGLPVVAVIARSSVNVNQGATSRWANFFHAIFVLLFVLLFTNMLTKIPLSALAGILVFTGYKLASPAKFRQMYQFGKDQFLIFLVTLIATLVFGLINGIGVGIAITFLVQFYLMEDRVEFLRTFTRPNTLLYEEEDGSLHLSVKGHSSFINYLKLKNKLDSIPANKSLILDFSLTTFVDNSVMEHIHYYKEDFKKKNSTLEVIGLDIHDSTSAHPFAARRLMRLTSFMKKGGVLTARQQRLKEFARDIDWEFKTNSIIDLPKLEAFPFFRRKTIDHAYNVFKGEHNGTQFKLMDVEFFEGELIVKEVHKHTVLILSSSIAIPRFRLDKERIFDRIAGMAGFEDIEIEGHIDFSRRFKLKGKNVKKIKAFFNNDLIVFFESHPYYHLESDGKNILILKGNRIASISEVKALAMYGKELVEKLK